MPKETEAKSVKPPEPVKAKKRAVTGPDTWCKVSMRCLLCTGSADRSYNGMRVLEFQVLTHEPWLSQYPPQKHSVVAFNKTADYVDACRPGDVLYVEGRLQNSSYLEKKSNTTVHRTKIVAEFIHVCKGQGNYAADIDAEIQKHTTRR